jgi:hypothetical protein
MPRCEYCGTGDEDAFDDPTDEICIACYEGYDDDE